PRAMIDIVGAKAGAHQLLEQISLFVRALGRTKARQRFRTMLVADDLQPVGGVGKRLLPGRRTKMGPGIGRIDLFVRTLGNTLLTDHRLLEPLGIVHVVEAETSLDAQAILVGRAILAADEKQLVILDMVGELAADAAVRTDAVDR